jgi:hypothetical protein
MASLIVDGQGYQNQIPPVEGAVEIRADRGKRSGRVECPAAVQMFVARRKSRTHELARRSQYRWMRRNIPGLVVVSCVADPSLKSKIINFL